MDAAPEGVAAGASMGMGDVAHGVFAFSACAPSCATVLCTDRNKTHAKWRKSVAFAIKWSGRQDSNLRHPAPKAGALPDCATPRPDAADSGAIRDKQPDRPTSALREDRRRGFATAPPELKKAEEGAPRRRLSRAPALQAVEGPRRRSALSRRRPRLGVSAAAALAPCALRGGPGRTRTRNLAVMSGQL